MAYQLRLGGNVGGDEGNGPGPLVHSAAPLGGQLLAGSDGFVRTVVALHQRPHLRIGDARLIAKRGGDVFAEVIVAFAVGGEIAPQIAAGRLVHVGNLLQQRIAQGYGTLVVVGSLAAAVGLLPGFLKIVSTDGRSGPDVAIAGDLAGVEKIIEHTELESQLMLVGGDGLAIHGQAGVAVAHRLSILLEVAEDLIVGAVFLDDVDDVLDAVWRSVREGDFLLGGLHPV